MSQRQGSPPITKPWRRHHFRRGPIYLVATRYAADDVAVPSGSATSWALLRMESA